MGEGRRGGGTSSDAGEDAREPAGRSAKHVLKIFGGFRRKRYVNSFFASFAKTYTVKAKSGKWCITFDNIPAKNLGDKYTVVASYGGKTATIQYSALSYINAVLAQEDTDSNANLKELCRAMILYNKYAKAYFGN